MRVVCFLSLFFLSSLQTATIGGRRLLLLLLELEGTEVIVRFFFGVAPTHIYTIFVRPLKALICVLLRTPSLDWP